MKTHTDALGLDYNPIITDTAAKAAMTLTEAIQGQIIGTTNDITGVIHNAYTQVLIHIILITKLNITDHPHTGAHQLTQETAAVHTLDQPTNQLRKPCTNLHHNPGGHKVKHILKGNQELQQMTHKWTFTVQMTIQVIHKGTHTI